ncbi:hypothetical protein PLESTB_000493200 [Pleodorina starrii]|uniref:Phosphoglycerate mutase n=1 Tax=Pleodorina starrii TaxID=330485 RepID=A0A9W6BGT6_9CHLO|nr:hypothetical protein PLESTM_000364700 [Pleodorina starrii]GLC51352.1 hypothetical protein PLESTB_000493200 [Pleodorina starrii]GLC63717.1 hypothetical protein PLESTF_000066700 [Pleodorina starrii]
MQQAPPATAPGGAAAASGGHHAARGSSAAAHTLILVRHGESVWNLANRFTGWTDVDLTEQGRRQAALAGAVLRSHGFHIDLAFTSVLKRAIRTLHILEDAMDCLHTPEVKSWRLNERHYGALQGLNKAETAAKHGDEQVHIWRRSYAVRPPALEPTDPRHPRFDARYGELDDSELPPTESLQDCVARTLPFWNSDIAPALSRGKRVLVAAHGNSLRGIVKHLDEINDEDIMLLEIPVGAPRVYELDEHLRPLRHYYLGQHLLAAPPLDVTALPPPLPVPRPVGGTSEVVEEAPDGEAEMQALMQALVSCGATGADHVHNAATATALVGDLAEAEGLMLHGSLAAAKYVFGYVPAAAVAAAAAVAPAVLAPAGPEAADLTGKGEEAEEGTAGLGSRAVDGVDSAGAEVEARCLAAFKRAAPLLDEERHVVVAMAAAAPPPPAVSGVDMGRMAAASLAASLQAMVGEDKKIVLAMPSGGGGGGGSAVAAVGGEAPPWSGCPAAWLGGGCVWACGVAGAEDAQVVAEALTCATGSVWEAPPGKI